jgi:condensin complex subunit 2
MSITPSLAEFRFSGESNPFNLDLLQLEGPDAPTPVDGDGPDADKAAQPGTSDFFDDGEHGDGGGGGDAFDYGGADDDGDNNDGQVGQGPVEAFDPMKPPNERDLVMAMADGGENMFDYFDGTLMKNWAGPEHWRMRRTVRRGGLITASCSFAPVSRLKTPLRSSRRRCR